MDERVKVILQYWYDWEHITHYQNPNMVSDLWAHTGWYGEMAQLLCYHKGDFFTNDNAALDLIKDDKWPLDWYINKCKSKEHGIYYQIRQLHLNGFSIISEGPTLAEAISLAVLKRIEQCQTKQS